MQRKAIAEALAKHRRVQVPALPGRTNHLRSGVLVPIAWRPEPSVLLTVRAATLRKHAREVAFPGGRPDPEDGDDLSVTARREAREEVGIEDAEILGRLSAIPLYTSDYRLFPFVAAVGGDRLVPNPAEVAEVLWVRLASVLGQPSINAIAWEHEGRSGMSPVFELGEHLLYGATAHTLHELLVVLAPVLGTTAPPLVPGKYTFESVLARQTGRVGMQPPRGSPTSSE